MSYIKIQVNSTISSVPLWESIYSTNTPEQMAEAAQALARAGMVYAEVWEGVPGQEWTTGEKVFAE